LLLVDIRSPNRKSNRVDRDIHQEDVQKLQGWCDSRDGNDLEASCTHAERLEDGVRYALADGNGLDDGEVNVEDAEADDLDDATRPIK
jgi:hypothetical protein